MPTSEAIVLPATVRPVKYRIKLQPDLDRFTFQGDESIDIHVVEATREIVLNALDLEIASATLHCGGSENTAESITFDEERQTATLSFGQQIPIG
ncbi:MAG: M1 family peptidase, partial [Chloroflexi bacterium]|nr:M1 family peptidase [Chloroflexota bacterium]